MAASQKLYERLSNDDGLYCRLRKDCAIFSELAYQEEEYVQKSWGNADIDSNKFADTLRGRAHARLILPPGLSAHARHVELLSRCRACRPIRYCGDATDAVVYIVAYNFPSDTSQTTSGPGRADTSPDIIILAFRGTDSLDSLLVADLGLPELVDPNRVLQIPAANDSLSVNAKVDLGFAFYFKDLIAKLQSNLCELKDSQGEDLSSKLGDTRQGTPIICTGHSLGGAASTLAALYLKMKFPEREVGFINMGSPRVGNHHFAQFVDDRFKIKCRVVNGCDPVVALPPNLPLPRPSGLGAFSDWIENFYYEHAGDSLQIGPPCGLTAAPPLDHCIALYIYHLTNPNSQNGDYIQLDDHDLRLSIDRYLRSPIQSAAACIRSVVDSKMATECRGDLTSAFTTAKTEFEKAESGGNEIIARAVGNVATLIETPARRALHFLAEWTHI